MQHKGLFAIIVSWAWQSGACAPDQTPGGTFTGVGGATGTAASGDYDFESLTRSCSGTCSITLGGDAVISACDVGARLEEQATITQTNGELVIDVDDSSYVSRLEGSLASNGAFDVDGTRTQQGGAISIYFRVTGTITNADTADTAIDGSGTGRVTGTVEGQTLNCNIVVDIAAQRR